MASTSLHCAVTYSPLLCGLSIFAFSQFRNKLCFAHVPLYIEPVMNAGKLLGEASLVAMNAIKLFAYVPLSFINSANWCLFAVTVIFHISAFYDRWSLFQHAERLECMVYF